MAAYIPWTPNEEEILRKMAAAKKTIDEIGAVLKSRSRPGIKSKAQNIGIDLLAYQSPEIDEEAFKRLMGGK